MHSDITVFLTSLHNFDAKERCSQVNDVTIGNICLILPKLVDSDAPGSQCHVGSAFDGISRIIKSVKTENLK